MCAGSTRWHMPHGQGSVCQLKPNGSTLRVVDSIVSPMAEAMNQRRGGDGRQISGRAAFRTKIRNATVFEEQRPSRVSRPMVTDCTTWPATFGNGVAIGTGPITMQQAP